MVKSNSLFTYLVTTLLFSFFLTNLPAQNVGIDLTNPLQKLDVDGAIRIGTTPDSIDGSIRYLSGDFQGYDGIKWRSFIQQISIDGDTIYLEDGGSVVLPPGNISSYIEDNDSDTRVHTEESPDEDIIRFDVAGTEVMLHRGQGLEMMNNGQSVFVGEEAGANDDFSNNLNVFIGYHSGRTNTVGDGNVAVGHNTLSANTIGFGNVALGINALAANDTGFMNIGIGVASLFTLKKGTGNIAIGVGALRDANAVSGNIAIGGEANSFNLGGINNTVIGHNAARGLGPHSKSGGVYIGYQAGFYDTTDNKLYIANNSDSALIYGEFDTEMVRIGGTLNIDSAFSFPRTDGTPGQILRTDGAGNVTWQNLPAGGGSGSALVTALCDFDNDTKVQVEESPDEDIIRFDLAGTEFATMSGHTLGIHNTGQSVFIGQDAGLNDNLDTNWNVFIGHEAGMANIGGRGNIAAGYQALASNVFGFGNTAIGHQALLFNTNGILNVAVGVHALTHNETGTSNTAIGREAMFSNVYGWNNVALGWSALHSNISGHSNAAFGSGTLLTSQRGARNTAIGRDAMRYHSAGSDNTAVGYLALHNSDSSDFNTAIGVRAMVSTETGSHNVAVGAYALNRITRGSDNISIGNYANQYNDIGNFNTAIGTRTMESNRLGGNNVMVGYETGHSVSDGSGNTMIGAQAGRGTGGAGVKHGNVFIGFKAGYNEGGSNKLYIENSDAGIPLIWGDFSANRVGINRTASTNSLEVDSTISSGDGLLYVNSDRRLKQNIRQLDSEEMLVALTNMQGVTYEWNDGTTGYKRPAGQQYGFIAQDIAKTFPEMVSEDNQGFLQTSYGAYDPMIIEAIKALNDKIESLENEIERLNEVNERSLWRMWKLEKKLEKRSR